MIYLFLILLMPVFSHSQIEIIQFNQRFAVIEVESKYVEVGFDSGDDDLLICWIEVKTSSMNFDFIYRRAVEPEECLFMVKTTKRILKTSKKVEIFGNGGSAYKIPYKRGYYTLFEMIRGESGCMNYFGGDECLGKEDTYNEMLYFEYRKIDTTYFPNLIDAKNHPYLISH